MRTHIHDRGKPGGCIFGSVYNARLSEDCLDFVACGKHPASAVKYYTPLGPLQIPPLLLLCANRLIVTAFEKL